ncbi:MOSC domain-containing protein [Pedobacter sp. PWIIR3]
MAPLQLSEIHIYPIKSLGGISLTEAHIEDRGLQYDRRWMLIDENNTFITQRKHFSLALLKVEIADSILTITHKNNSSQTISFSVDEITGPPTNVHIWDDTASGTEVNSEVSEWFSNFLQINVRLIKMTGEEKRLVDPRYASNHEIVSFADGYPHLIVGQSSLDSLNEKLEVPILMDRFRPNFVFKGGSPHIEDSFKDFTIGNIPFSAVKPCARCVLTTINQQTGAKGPEPLKTLAGYRTFNKKVLFGQNLIHRELGTVHIGDELRMKQ